MVPRDSGDRGHVSKIIARATTLHTSAFWILGVSARDDRQTIVRRADERSLDIDHALCQKCRAELTSPRTRLAAEMAWLPGVSPAKADQLVERLAENPSSVRSEVSLPILAKINLMTAALELLAESLTAAHLGAYVHELALLLERLDVEDTWRDINEDRSISRFPEISDSDQVGKELSDRKSAIRQTLAEALNRLPTQSIVDVMTELASRSTRAGAHHAPELVDQLIDRYEVEAHRFLEAEAGNVRKLIEAAREIAPIDRHALAGVLDGIESTLKNWDRVAQPVQLSTKARGLRHDASVDLAHEVRSLSVDLFNEHDLVSEAKRLTALLKEVFAEVPTLSERVEQDVESLDSIVQDRKEWAHQITYRAEIGAMTKHVLSVSPGGVSWKGRNYPLDEVTRVRWGGVKHSVNGIPTGTTYTIAFGDGRSEAVVHLRREDVYTVATDKIWRAVGVRLIRDLAEALKDGRRFAFGDAVVADDQVVLRRHTWRGAQEQVPCAWHAAQIWTADGALVIAAQADKKVYTELSYMHVPNVHVLEQLIRLGFERGIDRLSDVLVSAS
jgi:hypothetical protein